MQMKLRCKEGDVAIIIREEPGCEANVGRLVRVRGPIRADARQGPTWLIDTLDAAPFSYVRKGGVVGETLTSDLNIEHPDTWLQPIRRQRSHANGALKLELEPLPA